jgi:hypothetical protein
MDEELEMMALSDMMAEPAVDPMGDMGMDPMIAEMGGDPNADPMGVTEVPVPNWAVPAVIELISLLEQAGAAEAGGMDAGMMQEPMMPEEDMMMADMGPMPF